MEDRVIFGVVIGYIYPKIIDHGGEHFLNASRARSITYQILEQIAQKIVERICAFAHLIGAHQDVLESLYGGLTADVVPEFLLFVVVHLLRRCP
jgi:hypothetical protein